MRRDISRSSRARFSFMRKSTACLLSGGGLRGQILEAKTCCGYCGIQEMAYVLQEQDPWLDEQGWNGDGIYLTLAPHPLGIQ